jgi:hypothetical protein
MNINELRSVRKELAQHILDAIKDGQVNDNNVKDVLYVLFMSTYYIIGYHECKLWLKRYNIDTFDTINYYFEVYGLSNKSIPLDAEVIVNGLIDDLAAQMLHSVKYKTARTLKNAMNKLLKA